MNKHEFRGPWKRDDPKAGEKYANDVKNIIETQGPGKVACFIAESIQGFVYYYYYFIIYLFINRNMNEIRNRNE